MKSYVRFCVYACICTCNTCMCVYIYVCISVVSYLLWNLIYIFACTRVYVHMIHVHIYTYMYIFVCIFICICMTHANICIHTNSFTYSQFWPTLWWHSALQSNTVFYQIFFAFFCLFFVFAQSYDTQESATLSITHTSPPCIVCHLPPLNCLSDTRCLALHSRGTPPFLCVCTGKP